MLTQYHWQRGVIGCDPASRVQGIAYVGCGGKGFGGRVLPCLEYSRSATKSRCRVQSTRNGAPYGSSPLGLQRSGETFRSLGGLVRQHTITPNFADIEESALDWTQGFSMFPLLPLVAMALAFSRATSLMVSLGEEVKNCVRAMGSRNAKDCAVVDEFTEAAKGNLPWRPGLEKALMQQGGLSLALLSATAIAQDHLNPIIATLRANPTFMSGLIAWATAQVAKVFTYYMVVRQLDMKMVMGSGGMPSSHSALCFAMTTSVAFVHGVSDALFPVCLGFTLIVMYDAAGVRRHAGKQAEVLNVIVGDLFQGHPISERKLKELLGHTPLQVFAGAALGVIVGYFCSRPSLA